MFFFNFGQHGCQGSCLRNDVSISFRGKFLCFLRNIIYFYEDLYELANVNVRQFYRFLKQTFFVQEAEKLYPPPLLNRLPLLPNLTIFFKVQLFSNS